MIYHIVVGDLAAEKLQEAILNHNTTNEEVVILKDILHVGPLQKGEHESFSSMRLGFWKDVIGNDKQPIELDDRERIMELSTQLSNDADKIIWFWMAPNPADVCAYFLLIHLLRKHAGRFNLVNLANLPFLDENGKVFYPKSISEIIPRELIKARKLSRPLTPAEFEMDGDEWKRLTDENSGIRTFEGGKKMVSRSEDFYDEQLCSFCSHQFQKASKIVAQTIAKFGVPTGDVFLGYRIRKMAEAGNLQLQGELGKTLKDFDAKLPGEMVAPSTGI
jgi:hypothetical protein